MYRFFSFVCFIKIKKQLLEPMFQTSVRICPGQPHGPGSIRTCVKEQPCICCSARRSSKASKRRGAWTPEGDTREGSLVDSHSSTMTLARMISFKRERTSLKTKVGSSRVEKIRWKQNFWSGDKTNRPHAYCCLQKIPSWKEKYLVHKELEHSLILLLNGMIKRGALCWMAIKP